MAHKTYTEKRRLLIKTYLQVLLSEAEKRGQTSEEIVNDLARDAASWPEEDKRAAREELIWKAHPVKSGVIQ